MTELLITGQNQWPFNQPRICDEASTKTQKEGGSVSFWLIDRMVFGRLKISERARKLHILQTLPYTSLLPGCSCVIAFYNKAVIS